MKRLIRKFIGVIAIINVVAFLSAISGFIGSKDIKFSLEVFKSVLYLGLTLFLGYILLTLILNFMEDKKEGGDKE